MVLEPDCRGSVLELPYQAWRAFRKLFCRILEITSALTPQIEYFSCT